MSSTRNRSRRRGKKGKERKEKQDTKRNNSPLQYIAQLVMRLGNKYKHAALFRGGGGGAWWFRQMQHLDGTNKNKRVSSIIAPLHLFASLSGLGNRSQAAGSRQQAASLTAAEQHPRQLVQGGFPNCRGGSLFVVRLAWPEIYQ